MKNESVDGIREQTDTEKTIYNVIQNNEKGTMIASGYYLMTGLPYGTYEVSFLKGEVYMVIK